MLVTLITPTGWRKKVFALCETFVKRQTYKGELQWIVVSDDKIEDPTPCTMGQQYIQCPLIWRPGINTQRYNFAAAIPHVKGDVVFIWEDDDYFKPEYIEVMLDFIKYADLCGECDVTYYNLARKGFRQMSNTLHASLTSTAFKKSYLGHFENAVHSGNTYMDLALWGAAKKKGHKGLLFSGMNLCVGMKGLPGRSGIGFGHNAPEEEFTADPHLVKLKELIGETDAQSYINLLK